MKKFLILCLIFCTVLCTVSCNKIPQDNGGTNSDPDLNESNSYKVTMNDPDWLFEELKSEYRAGETVTVKIQMVTDTGTLFFVNGVLMDNESWSSAEGYWQYNFTMPNEDVTIDFKTYDGFLPDWNYSVLIEAYWSQNLDADHVFVKTYYGEYDSGAIVAMIDSGDYSTAEWSETVGESTFEYTNGNRITVLFDNVFYTLPEAFEKGYLAERDLADIADIHNGGEGIRHNVYEYNGFLYDDLKEKYYPGEELTIRVVAADGYTMTLFINGEKIEGGVLNESGDYTEYKFTMPDEDILCEIKSEPITE